jgi:hypothetical protein
MVMVAMVMVDDLVGVVLWCRYRLRSAERRRGGASHYKNRAAGPGALYLAQQEESEEAGGELVHEIALGLPLFGIARLEAAFSGVVVARLAFAPRQPVQPG